MRIRTALLPLAAIAAAMFTAPMASASESATAAAMSCDVDVDGGWLSMDCYYGGTLRARLTLDVSGKDAAGLFLTDKARDGKGVTAYFRRTSNNELLHKTRTASGNIHYSDFPLPDGTYYYAQLCLDGSICGPKGYGKG